MSTKSQPIGVPQCKARRGSQGLSSPGVCVDQGPGMWVQRAGRVYTMHEYSTLGMCVPRARRVCTMHEYSTLGMCVPRARHLCAKG